MRWIRVILFIFFLLTCSNEAQSQKSSRQTTKVKLSELSPLSLVATFSSPFASTHDFEIIVDEEPSYALIEALSRKPKNTNLSVIIDRPCLAICSRLLLPVADKVVFKENGFAALTDSTAKSVIAGEAELFFDKYNENSSQESLGNIGRQYQENTLQRLKDELEIVVKSGSNYTHLSYHSQARQILKRTLQNKCVPLPNIAVILDERYFRENRIKVLRDRNLPLDTKISYITENIKDVTIVKGFDFTVLYNYKYPDNPSVCMPSN